MSKKIPLIGGLILILITIPVVLYLISQNQDTRQRASGDEDPTCTTPGTPASILVDFPYCEGDSCDLTKGSCEWEAVDDAASYNVTVNQIENGTVIIDNQSTTDTKLQFPVAQSNTYKCSVVAVNACQGVSMAISDQLYCEADALLEPTPTNTPIPTQPPTPTSTPIPAAPIATPTLIAPTLAPTIALYTPTATPTLAPAGGLIQTGLIMGGIVFIIGAGILFLTL